MSTIVCADNFMCGITLSISKNRDVYSCGWHHLGAHGFSENILEFTQIPLLKNITSLAFGISSAVFLDLDGNVFTFGSNTHGQLGIGKDKFFLSKSTDPLKVDLPPIKQISSGNYFIMCVSEDNELFCFGNNRDGILGLGSNEESYFSPQKIESLKEIEFVECAGNRTFCKTFNNEFFCWGINDAGQLGIGNTDCQNIPIKCDDWPRDVVDIKGGNLHTLLLTENQQVFSCGRNINNELGRESDGIFIFI